MSAIRLMLVDDHVLFRSRLKRMFEEQSGITIVGEAEDASSAQSLAEALRPDVILMDVGLPQGDGILATEAITRKLPDIKVVVLSVHGQVREATRAIAAGAAGYLLKTYSAAELMAALHVVIQGWFVLDAAVGREIMERRGEMAQLPDSDRSCASLTDREMKILGLVGFGRSNREITGDLGCSISTVRNHLSRIYSKIGVKDRTQAAVYALAHGLAE
ncbi:MAG: response regulator transcription factor [Chloroflexota bacterium]|nr:MAG: response regulator transcription factor [Chloroflexota bacterium]